MSPTGESHRCDGGVHLDVWQDGQQRGSDAEQHVDADEDLVVGAAVRVGVVKVEEDHRHHRQQVVDGGDRQQSCEHTSNTTSL